VAAFVTAQARIKLYSELCRLNERVLYMDTDSIFFIERIGEYSPTLGNYLGQFTDEIDHSEGNHIIEFVSAGPKNYAYKLDSGITHCTVKGFTLNYLASLKLNYESIKNVVCNEMNKKIQVDQYKFLRNRYDWSITSGPIKKLYGFVYDKRILNEDMTSLPFGY